MTSRSRKANPTVWFWSKAEFARFINALEQLSRCVADLETLLQEPKNRPRQAAATRKAKQAAAEAAAQLARPRADSPEVAPGEVQDARAEEWREGQ
jgi:hypothetical protein